MEMLTEKRVKRLCYVMAGVFMIIHVGMLLLFARYQVIPMAWVNAASILFYAGMILLVRLGKLKDFVVSTFLEITFHMGLAVYFAGWGVGFQICLIGVCVLLFYAEYVGRSLKMETVRSIFLAPVAAAVYLAALIISNLRPARYTLPEPIEAAMQVFWALVVFGIMLAILQIFLIVAIRSQEELSSEAMHDKLTGLPNRYYMSSVFPKIMNRNCWLAIADLDDFKQLNDTYGHNCGDYVLQTVAEILRQQDGIEVCRWGGEEFLIASAKQDAEILQDVHRQIASFPFEYQGTKLHVTATIGMAWYREGHSIDEWINTADEKLYEGKKHGKNQVVS